MKTKYILTALASASFLSLTSCGDKEPETKTKTETTEQSLSSYILDEKPKEALSINAARKAPTPGAEITITGKIMGTMDPIVESAAVFVIGDPAKMKSCDLMADDHCKSPWDVCCDDPDEVKANIATIQLVDKDGKRIMQSIRGLNGLKELSTITAVGTIDKSSTEKNLIINATSIHIDNSTTVKEG